MFGNLLGKVKSEISDDDQKHKEIIAKIDKMNLTDMKTYIKNNISDFEVDEDGLSEVMRKLVKVNKETSKRYIEIDDMDVKIKKSFDLVLSVLISKKITVTTIELVNNFIDISKDIIEKYDKDNKQIYASRFKDAVSVAVDSINVKTELKRKMNLLEN